MPYKNPNDKKEYMQNYQKNNREKFNQANKRSYYKNHNKRIEDVRKYKEQHRNEIKEQGKLYYIKNKENINKRIKLNAKNNPEKISARDKIKYCLKTGKITKPLFCENCKLETELDAHHEDYSKPYDVTWLCRSCHSREHGMGVLK